MDLEDLSTMVGENFEIYTSQMDIIAFKFSMMDEENVETYTSHIHRIAFKLSTMDG